MADQTLPQNMGLDPLVPGSAPPPANQAVSGAGSATANPNSITDASDKEEDLASLSPFAVLKKKMPPETQLGQASVPAQVQSAAASPAPSVVPASILPDSPKTIPASIPANPAPATPAPTTPIPALPTAGTFILPEHPFDPLDPFENKDSFSDNPGQPAIPGQVSSATAGLAIPTAAGSTPPNHEIAPAADLVASPVSTPIPSSTPGPASIHTSASEALLKPSTENQAGTQSGTQTSLSGPNSVLNGKTTPPLAVMEMGTASTLGKPGQIPFNPAKKNKVGLVAFLGLLIALVILSVTAFVLVQQGGVRLPIVYKLVSGLETDGLKVSQTALALVKHQQSYQQTGEITLAAKGAATTSDRPDLPLSTTSGLLGTGTKVSRLNNKIEASKLDQKENTYSARFQISTDNQADVPVQIRQAGQNSTGWEVYLPANLVDSKIGKVSPTELKKTLLYPLLKPVSLQSLLGAVDQETSYQKNLFSGKSVVIYTYTLKKDKFGEWLPEGAALSNPFVEIGYYWGTGLPAYATLHTTLSFEKVDYQYTGSSWTYGSWNQDFSQENKDNLQSLLNSVSTAPDLAMNSFISQLGIIPNTLPVYTGASPDSSTGAVTPTPTPATIATPTATAAATASPSATPSATSVTAVQPTGEGVTQAQAAITTAPPVPTQPASTAAKSRDTQRKKDLADLQRALEMYKTRQGKYPISNTSIQTGSSSVLIQALVPTYITKIPIDPLKQVYWYEYRSDGNTFRLTSLAENTADATAKKGNTYSFFEVNN